MTHEDIGLAVPVATSENLLSQWRRSGEGGCRSSMPTILDILFLPSLFTLTPGKASLTRRERFVTLRLSPGNDLSSSSVPQTTAQIPQNSLGTMHVVYNY